MKTGYRIGAYIQLKFGFEELIFLVWFSVGEQESDGAANCGVKSIDNHFVDVIDVRAPLVRVFRRLEQFSVLLQQCVDIIARLLDLSVALVAALFAVVEFEEEVVFGVVPLK